MDDSMDDSKDNSMDNSTDNSRDNSTDNSMDAANRTATVNHHICLWPSYSQFPTCRRVPSQKGVASPGLWDPGCKFLPEHGLSVIRDDIGVRGDEGGVDKEAIESYFEPRGLQKQLGIAQVMEMEVERSSNMLVARPNEITPSTAEFEICDLGANLPLDNILGTMQVDAGTWGTERIQQEQHVNGTDDGERLEIPDQHAKDKLAFRSHSRLPFGTTLSGIQPTHPAIDEFIFDTIPLTITPTAVLSPPPPLPPPSNSGHTYPLSPVWTLKNDSRWMRGCCYTAPKSSHPGALDAERTFMMNITLPPNISPLWDEEHHRYVVHDIPGMVRMPAGIPFVFEVDGKPERPVTSFVLHTLDSLSQHPEYPTIKSLLTELFFISFGRVGDNGEILIRPLFTYDDLKRNDRSVQPSKSAATMYDGSYNLAATLEKGNGKGTVVPAVQAAYSSAKETINRVLIILHQLYRLIMPWSLSKQEMDINDFHSGINNVFSIGGMLACGTSVQMNISSSLSGGDLLKQLGSQGWVHLDGGDDFTRPSLFPLFFRLPEGADPGPFLLLRGGLYCRETQTWVVLLVFRGNDLHSGFSPSSQSHGSLLDAGSLDDLSKTWDNAGKVNRCGYVVYHSAQATQRASAMSVTPATRFGNFGTRSATELKSLNFSEHGRHILGTPEDAASRLAHELTFQFMNGLAAAGLQPTFTANHLLDRLRFYAPDTETSQPVRLTAYDPAGKEDWISRMESYYAGQWANNSDISLGMTKEAYKRHQIQLRSNVGGGSLNGLELRSITVTKSVASPSKDPHPKIRTVLAKIRGGLDKITWKVVTESGAELLLDQDENPWLQSENAAVFQQFIASEHRSQLPEVPIFFDIAGPLTSRNSDVDPSPSSATAVRADVDREPSAQVDSEVLDASSQMQEAPTSFDLDFAGAALSSNSVVQPSPSTIPAVRTDDDLELSAQADWCMSDTSSLTSLESSDDDEPTTPSKRKRTPSNLEEPSRKRAKSTAQHSVNGGVENSDGTSATEHPPRDSRSMSQASASDDEFEIEAVVDHSHRASGVWYKVRYKGYLPSEDLWHEISNLP
ncbi:hypothetical protein FA95DRAFT_1613779 [Auriscalpium vulgare]|uniref:Uncharacterized protein n=1 Tax=Auriscalpium vulgare TaxID=40419 RepID=A0ACB8R1D9_9AGAM|nr:hypothetical protein FA95DRAFT_1613779 [Auriscalpium vulgare]